MRRLLATLVLGAACLSLSACASVTQNVRAYRAYALEEPSLVVALDRTEDIARSLELVDRLLLDTPYTPGDAWVGEIALQDAEAREIKAQIKEKPPYDSGDHEVPVAKVYRIHLERVLEKAPKSGEYPCILDAVAALGEGSGDLKTHWGTARARQETYALAQADYEHAYDAARAKHPPGQPFVEGPELLALKAKADEAKTAANDAQKVLDKDFDALAGVKLDEGKRGQTIKDGTAVLSIAYRLELEASALIPIVAVQALRSIPKLGQELSETPTLIKGIKELKDLPEYISVVRERMVRQIDLLETMTKVMAKVSATTLEQTPGFALRETIVDQVVGVTVDSFRVNVKAGAEAFFFSSVAKKAGQQAGGQDSKNKETFDYDKSANGGPGREFKLNYNVKPILLAAANINVGFDWIRLPNAANFNLGYKTDRLFNSGGSIDNSGSFSKQLGVKGVASDALDFGLGVLGVKTNVRVATFTAGEVQLVNARDGSVAATAPFQIAYTQIDAGYDIAFLMGESAGKYYIEELTVGGRYMNYRLPRILYEMENQNPPDSEEKNWLYVRESPPQLVVSKYFMGGVLARFGPGPAPTLSPFADLGIFAGGGPSAYYFIKEPFTLDVPQLREHQDKTAIAADVALALGARYRFSPRASRIRANAELVYRAELIYSRSGGATSDTGKERIVDFGSMDVFHGPRFSFVGEF